MKSASGLLFFIISAVSLHGQDPVLLDRSVKQTENRLEIRYSFMTDTVRGFFTIEELFSTELKMVSHKLKAPFTYKENKLKIMGATVKGLETFVFVFEGNGNVDLECKAKFENYPWNSLENKFEKSSYVLEKTELVAEVKKEEKVDKETNVIAVEESKQIKVKDEAPKNENLNASNNVTKTEDGSSNTKINPSVSGIRFRVQLAASASKMDVQRLKSMTGLNQVVFEDIIDNLYKYTIGDETDISGAQAILNKLAVNNFKKPFIVAYKDGKRISMTEARLK